MEIISFLQNLLSAKSKLFKTKIHEFLNKKRKIQFLRKVVRTIKMNIKFISSSKIP